MGYYYNSSDSGVAGYSKYHRGYPGCGASNAPAGCTSSTMWGQSFTCQTGGFFGSVNGWNRNGPYIVAVNIAESCKSTDCEGDATPNVAFRIYKTLAENMSYYRSVY